MITPQQEAPLLAEALGLSVPLYLKREDLHPYGSHKGRSIPYMIEAYARGGATKFAISSSGNAALAAGMYIEEYNKKFTESQLTLQIFVGENINPAKLQTLKHQSSNNPKITITQTDKPKQSVHVLNKRGEAKALRQSDDDLALAGYKSLVEELSEIKNLGAIFIPTSSGTTAEALATPPAGGLHAQIHIAQTNSCHPIAKDFDQNFTPADKSTADAIVDIVAMRREELKLAIQKSGGYGWVCSDNEITNAMTLVKSKTGLEISPNSALSIAALSKALLSGWQAPGAIACLITGL